MRKATAMASATRSQVVVEEGEAKRKAQEIERMVAKVEWATKAVAAHGSGYSPSPPYDVSSPSMLVHKLHRTFSDRGH
jgi:hypothetical protein